MYRNGYCRYCSTENVDVRELEFIKNKVRCLSCGRESFLVSAGRRNYVYIQSILFKEESNG